VAGAVVVNTSSLHRKLSSSVELRLVFVPQANLPKREHPPSLAKLLTIYLGVLVNEL